MAQLLFELARPTFNCALEEWPRPISARGGANDRKCWGVAKPSTLEGATIVPDRKTIVMDLRNHTAVFDLCASGFRVRE